MMDTAIVQAVMLFLVMTSALSMDVALTLQWGLLVAFLAAWAFAALAYRLWPRTRPVAFAVGFVSAAHAVYYALFLVWPGVLGAQGTMLFSIGLRWLVLFVAVFMLAMALRREQWPT